MSSRLACDSEAAASESQASLEDMFRLQFLIFYRPFIRHFSQFFALRNFQKMFSVFRVEWLVGHIIMNIFLTISVRNGLIASILFYFNLLYTKRRIRISSEPGRQISLIYYIHSIVFKNIITLYCVTRRRRVNLLVAIAHQCVP